MSKKHCLICSDWSPEETITLGDGVTLIHKKHIAGVGCKKCNTPFDVSGETRGGGHLVIDSKRGTVGPYYCGDCIRKMEAVAASETPVTC